MPDTTSPRDSSPEDDPQQSDTAPDSGPIDIHELLESTRKLFAVDDAPGAEASASVAEHGDSSAAVVDSSGPLPDSTANPAADPVTEPLVSLEGEDKSAGEGGEADEDQELGDTAPARGFTILAPVSLVLALLASPVAVIFGYVALGQARRANQRGEAIALWGIGLGWVVLAAWVVGAGSLWWIAAQEGITLDSLGELIEFLRIP